jgi:hypothetical protein
MAKKRGYRHALKGWQHLNPEHRCLIEVSGMLILVCLLEHPVILSELGAGVQFVLLVVQLWCAIKGCNL